MIPLKNIVSCSPSCAPPESAIRNSEQYGRSATSLRADEATISLRSNSNATADTAGAASLQTSEGSGTLQSPLSHTASNSLRPVISSSPVNSPADTNTALVGRSDSSVPLPATDTDGPAQSLHVSFHPSRPRRLGARNFLDLTSASYSVCPPANPLTVSDLGVDYTRYYNPYNEKPTARSGTSTPAVTNPFLTPNASTTQLHPLYDAEKNMSLIDDRLSAPYEENGAGVWPMIGDQAEADDEMHMPSSDDDAKFKVTWRERFRRENIVSTFGIILMLLGLCIIFLALPIMSSTGVIDYNSAYYTPLDQMRGYRRVEEWAKVNDRDYSLLKNVRTGLIDPGTPKAAKFKKGQFGDDYELVFSDEFNKPGRTFYEGDDPFWYAPDIWYGATKDLEWYDPDAVSTAEGTLNLKLEKFPNHGVEFRSGMLNSWNHLCFKGGIFEVSVSLPGPAGVPGLWPGVWTMGNLGRPGYLSTTDGLWPYTYQGCDVGITSNQSSADGLSNLPGQRLSSCTCRGEDHPTPGTGRGAPEIDIIEVGSAYAPFNMSIATQSYQVAPFDVNWYPNYDYVSTPDYSLSWRNSYTGGPYQQAISSTTNLNHEWYDGNEYQRFSFEYVPGEGKDAYIVWKVGDATMFMLDGRAIGPNGNIQARQISEEPMSLVLNLGLSESWTFIDWAQLTFPTTMRVDYVRWYQKKGEEHLVTCDPPGFETTQYIKEHLNAYTNPNFTLWEQTGHRWPKNKLTSDCDAE